MAWKLLSLKNTLARPAAWRGLLAALTALALTASCSGDDEGRSPKKPAPPDTDSEWAVHVYVGEPGAWKRFDFGPVPEVSFPAGPFDGAGALPGSPADLWHGPPNPSETGSKGGKAPGSKAQAVVDAKDGGVQIDQTLSTDPKSWALVAGAAAQCRAGGRVSKIVVPPWAKQSDAPATYAWSIFQSVPRSCDTAVIYSEQLLCVANELARVAEAVSPVTWDKITSSPVDGIPDGPWTLPPQRNADRFILRDLSIYMLATLALNDMWIPSNAPAGTTTTCSEAYADAVANPGAADPQWLFGAGPTEETTYFPKKLGEAKPTAANIPALAETRLKFNTQILRGASRLLKELIEDSVTADLAGTEKRRGRATDPQRGSELAWGQRKEEDGGYNSLAHAVRVLTGRWELSPIGAASGYFGNKFYTADPACGGVVRKDLLSKDDYGPDLSARVNDRSATTAGQKLALDAVSSAGIVIPKTKLDQPTGIADARKAVRSQLLSNAAKSHGIPPGDPVFEKSGQGASIGYVLDQVADGDLAFALGRTFGQYQLLAAAKPDVPDVTAPGAGLEFVAADQVTDLQAVNGVALANGMPRQDVAGDFTGRAAGLFEAAQCDEFLGPYGQLFAANNGYRSGFQDSFAIAQALGRRLVLLRERASTVPKLNDNGITDQAAKAAAETRAWAGPGRMAATAIPNDDGGVGSIWVFTTGLQPKDLAVADASAMKDELVLVHGPPWVADCAAGTRTNCPDDFEDKYVVTRTWAESSDGPGLPSDWKALTGSDGTVGLYAFPGSNGKEFNPAFIANAKPGTLPHLYVVARHDPLGPNGRGKVLGSIAVRFPFGGTGMPISWLQQKLLSDVLGVSNKWRDQFGRIGVDSTSTSPAYCIEGVPKDLFVPLENELTSDSDQYENSWKHYLTLAKQAAQKADDLGQKLIELGLQQDLRREAAGESLANICGDFSAMDEIKIENGVPKAPQDDENLKSCLEEEKFDLVLLTNDPAAELSETGRTAWVKEKILDCPNNPQQKLCTQSVISYGALNLATYLEKDTSTPAECAIVTALAGSIKDGFKGDSTKSIANADWASAVKLKFLSERLQVFVDPSDSHWELRVSGEPMMSSASNAKLWPGCRRTGAGGCPAGAPDVWDTVFRRAPSGSPLGTGPDGNGGQADREANMLLWRVQGAAWLLAALGGGIPDQMFRTVLPAANFKGLSWGPSPQAPVFTVFATGKFDSGLLEAAVDEKDRNLVGLGHSIPTSFWWPISGEIPDWLTAVYLSPGDKYLHIEASNPELGGFGTKNVSSWLDQQLARLTGAKCEYSGGPVFEGSAAGPSTKSYSDALAAVSAIRAGSKWGQICQNAAGATTVGMSKAQKSLFLDRYEFSHSCEIAQDDPECFVESFQKPKLDIPLFPKSAPDGSLMATYVYALHEAPSGDGASCNHARVSGVHQIPAACAATDSGSFSGARYTQRMLLPRACSPSNRVQVFVNSYPPPGVCGAASQLAQALALACQYGVGGWSGNAGSAQPTVSKLADLDGLVLWIGSIERQAREQVGKLYVEKVPMKVVNDYAATKVGTGVSKGEHGSQLLELRKALETLAGAWNRVAGDVAQLRTAVDHARTAVIGAKIDGTMASAQLAIQSMQIHSNMIAAASGMLTLDPGKAMGGAINAEAQLGFGSAMLDQTAILEKLSKEKHANQVQAALSQLQLTSNPLYTDLQNAIGDIRSSTATVLSISNAVQQSESQAKYEAAKGSGADFVMIDGKPVKFPVNTVQNRLYDITRLRYLGALDEAKYLAYVARLAIEQRIGQRLNTIATPVGPIEAPKEWADDVCSLTGINYQKLRDFDTDAGAGSDGGVLEQHQKDLIAEFADQYVGDYVDKLGNFVEYYNIAYPSHDGDDTAVLSLKDDLLGPTGGCVKEAPNLLFYSSALESFDVLTEGGQAVTRGWELNPCDAADIKCLRVSTGATMNEPASALPVVAPIGRVTWLHDETNPLAGAPVPDGGAPLPVPALPTRTVSQAVSLTAGSTYVLSWWDQARTTNGSLPPTGSTGVKYRVAVLAPDGSQVEGLSVAPHLPSTSQPWSERQSLDFKASQTGTYRVLLGASFEGTEQGSVALANVQLEQGAPGSLPSAYVNTGASRLYLAPECTGKTAEDAQKAFRHVCDESKQCYYELVAPIVVDTNGLGSGKSRLNGKLAAGNFNFRHITLAVNLVGTGVYDCTANPSPSCFGSAFIEYTLDHDAFQAGVIGWNGDVQTFNFGSAGINHGKALAAEKYITLPIGSGDQNLLAQPGIEKPEYRGRPLDGSYRLRIWDSPYLMWNRVEDIQLVLKYRYWSRIQPQPAP